MGLTVSLRRQPHAQQVKFIEAGQPEQLYGGAKRGGKTIALGQKMVLLATAFPGNRILLCRKNFTDLVDTTLHEFFITCPPELIISHNKSDRRIVMRSSDPRFPSEIIYRGLGDLHELEKVKSINIGALVIDEPSEIEFETYLMLRSQLTWTLPAGGRPPYMCLLGCNPEPGWVKERFITDPQPGTIFIPALPRDNPYLPDGWENDLRLAGYPEEWVKKYLEGSWDVAEGQVFPELGEVHMLDEIPPTEFLQQCGLIGALDHATTGITAFTISAITPSQEMIVLEEYYKANRLISEHAMEVRSLISRYEAMVTDQWKLGTGRERNFIRYVLIDPSTTAKTLQGHNQLQSVADEYRGYGLNVIPAWNALEMGINIIKEHLRVDERHLHPYTRVAGSPTLFFVRPHLPNTLKEMQGLKKEVTETGRIKYVGTDHGTDTIRYQCNSRPRRPEVDGGDQSFMTNQERHGFRAHSQWVRQFDSLANGGQGWFPGAHNQNTR